MPLGALGVTHFMLDEVGVFLPGQFAYGRQMTRWEQPIVRSVIPQDLPGQRHFVHFRWTIHDAEPERTDYLFGKRHFLRNAQGAVDL